MADRSLLTMVKGLLVRTYRLRGSPDVSRFVIGDSGYRMFYEHRDLVETVAAATGAGARTLVRETGDGLAASVYFPDEMIRSLERCPPQRGLQERNVDAFATLVEELDHLLCLADGLARDRTVSLFELELHANVSKHLVLARFLAGSRPHLSDEGRVWLRFHLFEKYRFRDADPEVRERYRDAARWAVKLIDCLGSLRPAARLETLREFHRGTASDKLGMIRGLAAGPA